MKTNKLHDKSLIVCFSLLFQITARCDSLPQFLRGWRRRHGGRRALLLPEQAAPGRSLVSGRRRGVLPPSPLVVGRRLGAAVAVRGVSRQPRRRAPQSGWGEVLRRRRVRRGGRWELGGRPYCVASTRQGSVRQSTAGKEHDETYFIINFHAQKQLFFGNPSQVSSKIASPNF